MKILLATDGSEFSRAAIEKCCEIAVKPENTEIKIISVYQVYIPLDMYPQSAQIAQEFECAMHEQAANYVDQAVAAIRKSLPDANVELSIQVTMGATDRVIIETAENWNADLIVVGSHGRGFWGRNLIGSVSDSLVHHAPCSVLVVRKTERETSSNIDLTKIDLTNIT